MTPARKGVPEDWVLPIPRHSGVHRRPFPVPVRGRHQADARHVVESGLPPRGCRRGNGPGNRTRLKSPLLLTGLEEEVCLLIKVPEEGREELPRLATEVAAREAGLQEHIRNEGATLESIYERFTH